MGPPLRDAHPPPAPPPTGKEVAPSAGGRRRGRAWLGPLLAALIVLVSAAPGLIRLPPLDRDESRFAQATAQMVETGDYVDIRFQEEPRDKKPVGIHWLQAAAVSLLSTAESRAIAPYRLPSLLGAMAAAAACAWGAQGLWSRRTGAAAGAILGASLLLSTEAGIAKTDAVLCGAVTLAMAALGRLYLAGAGVGRAETGTRLLFWLGMAVSILVKGPIGPLVAGLAILALWAADREARWARRLGWSWGLLLVAAVVGPWAAAITVSTDAGFWGAAIGGDLAPKLVGGHETHGAPPGLHLLLSPLLLFPAGFLIPAALVHGWRTRGEPATRFALAWLVPGWLVFEAMPTKLVHYPLPLYGALAWLAAASLAGGAALGPRVRWSGAALSLLAGGLLAAVAVVALNRYGDAGATGWAVAVAALASAAGAAGALLMIRGRPQAGLLAAGGLGVLAHGALLGGLAPALKPLWVSERAAHMVAATGLDPRNGLTPGPVAVAGYAEPSLVFALGTPTALGGGREAAEALADGQPVLVEGRQEPAFRAALAAAHTPAAAIGEVRGLDYSTGKPVALRLWRPAAPPPPADSIADSAAEPAVPSSPETAP